MRESNTQKVGLLANTDTAVSTYFGSFITFPLGHRCCYLQLFVTVAVVGVVAVVVVVADVAVVDDVAVVAVVVVAAVGGAVDN